VKKILFAAFDPFGGEAVNPALEAVKLLSGDIGSIEIVKLELPTVFGRSFGVLGEAIEEYNPNAVLCVGQAGGRSRISIEKVAINLADARIADNDGNQPEDEVIIPGAPAAYFTNLPVRQIISSVKADGIPAGISYSAGTFVCNDIMYRLMHLISTERTQMLGGFIHIPYDTAQAVNRPEGTPTMPTETVCRALMQIAKAL